MTSLASFYWFFIQHRFAEALAHCPTTHSLSSSQLWANYRLYLYHTVASQPCTQESWRVDFARSVSLAATGQAKESSVLIRKLIKRRLSSRIQTSLASALAPFTPEISLEILQGCSPPATLHAALLSKLGYNKEAHSILDEAIKQGMAKRHSELHLFMSNAESGDPMQQLNRMNAFLNTYALSPLALRCDTRPPGQSNLKSLFPVRSFRGPLVSILMTAYNSSKRIASAISSLLEQSYRDIEVVIIDDASSDATGTIVRAMAALDSRIVYLQLPRNVGTYVAKSIGLQHARGEFITCHDSDDWSHPRRIELQMRPLLDNKRLVFTTSHWVRIQDDGTYYARSLHPLKRLNPASPLFRRDIVLRQAGGWDPVRTGADSEFHARLKLVFGRGAMRRLIQPLAFGAHRQDSLMTAGTTGYSSTGISPTRLSYWENWGHWHINELTTNRKPYISPDLLAPRSFPAPADIEVPLCDIKHCLDTCTA